MPTPMLIVCPGCHKESQGSTDLLGKKIRCKACGEVFPVQKPVPAKAVATAKPGKKKEEALIPILDEVKKPKSSGRQEVDDSTESKPYQVTDLDLATRCPHCAAEMEAGGIICLTCGYNTQSRHRFETRKVIGHTGGEKFIWLLPGILCVICVLTFIGAIVFLWVQFPTLYKQNEAEWWGGFFGFWAQIWGSVVSTFIIWFSGRYAFIRLVFHPNPPEKIKH
jgi:hypothetical protein